MSMLPFVVINKVTMTSKVIFTFLSHKVGQNDQTRHRDLWGLKEGHGDLLSYRDLLLS